MVRKSSEKVKERTTDTFDVAFGEEIPTHRKREDFEGSPGSFPTFVVAICNTKVSPYLFPEIRGKFCVQR